MCYEEIKYKDKQDMIDRLVGKKIVDWNQDYLKLDDGTVITIEMTESDCCATASGEFKNVELEAVITDIRFNKPILNNRCEDETYSTQEVVFVHNQNKIGQADLYADNGNGDYYYSVVAFKIKSIYYAPLGSGDGE
ncbi:hypothetical protein NH286_03315 [Anaerococcus sp. NML200574]|uniref:DUF7448 domain-containing protein n=1 Tax=Anaerococcus sp. NML200574 TaxID=2954486 RepID=UPI0022377155|nr:hypothetical protein [Anaerococcus sp. NML200574]MCW6678182.1 hypothetical protein [Anaerococcus sp. NML200574]